MYMFIVWNRYRISCIDMYSALLNTTRVHFSYSKLIKDKTSTKLNNIIISVHHLRWQRTWAGGKHPVTECIKVVRYCRPLPPVSGAVSASNGEAFILTGHSSPASSSHGDGYVPCLTHRYVWGARVAVPQRSLVLYLEWGILAIEQCHFCFRQVILQESIGYRNQ